MLFKEIIAVNTENHMKPVNKNVALLILKQMVRIVTTKIILLTIVCRNAT
jgi:hypothetical protein